MQTIDLDPKRVRRSFERAARDYDKVAGMQREVAERLLGRLDLIRIQPNRLGDFGSGTGYCSRHLAKRYRGARIVSLDLALTMVQEARRQAPRLFGRPAHVCGDLQQLPLAPSSMDLIVSNLTLQWCSNLRSTFEGLSRVLAPGGLVLFSTFGPDTLHELRESWRQVDSYVHVNDFPDMHDVGDAMAAAGLRDVVVDVDRITVHYPDLRALMRELKTMGAHNVNRGRPPGLTGKQRLRRVIQAYETLRNQDGLPASYEVVYGHAWGPEAPGVTAVKFPVTTEPDK